MSKRKLYSVLILTTATMFAGCNMGPDYKRPTVQMPAQFAALPTTQPSTQPTVHMDLVHWWETLGDPELDRLLNKAVESNLDLQVAVGRLREAQSAECSSPGRRYQV